MKLTIKHFYDFQDFANNLNNIRGSLNSTSWDVLRLNNPASDNIFAIPETSPLWQERILASSVLERRAKAISDLMQGRFSRLNSYGVGAAGLEFLIKRQTPHIFLQCSDYAPKTIERLRKVFREADRIIQFDILKDRWINDGSACLYLFHRIDTELDDREWRMIFGRASSAGIQYILFVPSEFLTFRRFIRQKIKLFSYSVLREKITFTGYLRTREQFKTFFYKNYEIEQAYPIGDLQGLLLKHID